MAGGLETVEPKAVVFAVRTGLLAGLTSVLVAGFLVVAVGNVFFATVLLALLDVGLVFVDVDVDVLVDAAVFVVVLTALVGRFVFFPVALSVVGRPDALA